MAPAVVRVAMMVLIQVALETVQHVINIGEARLFQREPGIHGATARTADQHNGAIEAGRLFYLCNEVRIDFPFGPVYPWDQYGTLRVADKHVLHFTAHIDEYRLWIRLQEVEGFLGGKVLHSRVFLDQLDAEIIAFRSEGVPASS